MVLALMENASFSVSRMLFNSQLTAHITQFIMYTHFFSVNAVESAKNGSLDLCKFTVLRVRFRCDVNSLSVSSTTIRKQNRQQEAILSLSCYTPYVVANERSLLLLLLAQQLILTQEWQPGAEKKCFEWKPTQMTQKRNERRGKKHCWTIVEHNLYFLGSFFFLCVYVIHRWRFASSSSVSGRGCALHTAQAYSGELHQAVPAGNQHFVRADERFRYRTCRNKCLEHEPRN